MDHSLFHGLNFYRKPRSEATTIFKYLLFAGVLFFFPLPVNGSAPKGLLTQTFCNAPHCSFPNTQALEGKHLHFDISALPSNTPIYRAVIRIPTTHLKFNNVLELVPVGLGPHPLKASAPDYKRLDALSAVQQWVQNPTTNKGLSIQANNRNINLQHAILEVTTIGPIKNTIPAISQLRAEHRQGQTFLTWTEVEDIVGQDHPIFEDWEKAILSARNKRDLSYRIYGHTQPITSATIHEAILLREIPEALSGWNTLAIQTLEFSPGTKRSPLLPGKIKIDQQISRFAIREGGKPLPRTTGLAVISATRNRHYYYAISVAIDGKESLHLFEEGRNTTARINESQMRFPQFVTFKKVAPKNPKKKRRPHIHIRVAWLEPPYVMEPRPTQFYFLHYPNARKGTADHPAPLYLFLSQYGASSRVLSKPRWVDSKTILHDVYGIAFAESEDSFWAGMHQSVGTLRSYADGIVINHGQRRILMTREWALAQTELHLDPQRVYISGQHAIWALRHGDLFAAVGSNGYGNLRLGRESQKRFPHWGAGGMGKNWLGIPHLDYLDLAQWVRQHPSTELPYWVCHPSYGKFPSHTLGDFGFKPWQDFILAMQETKRAFAAIWNANGQGALKDLIKNQLPNITRDQSLPAFSRVSFNRSPYSEKPRGPITKKFKRIYEKKMDMDFINHADRDGGINLYQRWESQSIVDEPRIWEISIWLAKSSPEEVATMDITPRRLQKFHVQPGGRVRWHVEGEHRQSGTAIADQYGLVTLPAVKISQSKSRIRIEK